MLQTDQFVDDFSGAEYLAEMETKEAKNETAPDEPEKNEPEPAVGLHDSDYANWSDGMPVCTNCPPTKNSKVRYVAEDGNWVCTECAEVLRASHFGVSFDHQQTSTMVFPTKENSTADEQGGKLVFGGNRRSDFKFNKQVEAAEKKEAKRRVKTLEKSGDSKAAKKESEARKQDQLEEDRKKLHKNGDRLVDFMLNHQSIRVRLPAVNKAAHDLLREYFKVNRQLPTMATVQDIAAMCVWWALASAEMCMSRSTLDEIFRTPTRLTFRINQFRSLLRLPAIPRIKIALGITEFVLRRLSAPNCANALERARIRGLARWIRNSPFLHHTVGSSLNTVMNPRKRKGPEPPSSPAAVHSDLDLDLDTDSDSDTEGPSAAATPRASDSKSADRQRQRAARSRKAKQENIGCTLDAFFVHIDLNEARIARGEIKRSPDLREAYETRQARIYSERTKLYEPHSRETMRLLHPVNVAKLAQEAAEQKIAQLNEAFNKLPPDEQAIAQAELDAASAPLKEEAAKQKALVEAAQEKVDTHYAAWNVSWQQISVKQQHPFLKINDDQLAAVCLYAVLSRPGSVGTKRDVFTAEDISTVTGESVRNICKNRRALWRVVCAIQPSNYFPSVVEPEPSPAS